MGSWHQLETQAALDELQSDAARGLSAEESRRRLEEYGPNELKESAGRGAWLILWQQLSGTMILLLVGAAVVSFFLGEMLDAGVILAIVVINAALGFAQDYRAEKALAALKKLAVPLVRVRREHGVKEISSRELVPGDVVVLEVGNQVPADCRLLDESNLKIQEAALTGESEPIHKRTDALPDADVPLGDRVNMAYMGTMITYGRGHGLVVATGMETELGKIAGSLQSVTSEPTPLQTRLAHLGRTLVFVALGIVALVVVVGLARGEPLRLMLMTALSLAVAVVPEGLPAVATVALALGARRMFGRHALIRKLPAVETLGSVTVICSDKTGTLTENQMTVALLDTLGKRFDLRDSGGAASGSEAHGEAKQHIEDNPAFALMLAGMGLCNDAELDFDEQAQEFLAVGDPTEAALSVAAAELGLPAHDLAKFMPRVEEIPFDADRKRMTTIHDVRQSPANVSDGPLRAVATAVAAVDGGYLALTKGAVNSVLDASQSVFENGAVQPVDDSWRERIAAANDELAGKGMRVLGVGYRAWDQLPDQLDAETVERDLVFLGMVALIDPPRPEVAEAVSRCRTAGIRPIMITGDHPLTAQYIAKELRIAENDSAVTGRDLESTNNNELKSVVEQTAVYARVTPHHKLKLVQALQDNGHIVAMTGDGVNDAPALKQAHIGVAMGITGTDVAKEASQMVLLDDNFATIVNAVEEGRIVYDNIRKFVKYTMTSNAGEIWVMLLGPLLGMPLPLLPLQILWVNLVTDGLPGLALAVEKSERRTMQRPPYPPSETLFGRGMGIDIAWIGLLMGVVSLAMGYWTWAYGKSPEIHWRTMVFTVLTLAQMGNALAIRSEYDSLFRIGIFSNPALIGSVLLTVALQMLVVYWPPLQTLFKTTALTGAELALSFAIATIVFWAVEARKWIRRLKRPVEEVGGE